MRRFLIPISLIAALAISAAAAVALATASTAAATAATSVDESFHRSKASPRLAAAAEGGNS